MLTCFKINGFPLILERTEMKTTINDILLKNKAFLSMAEGRRLARNQSIKLNGFPVQNVDMKHEFYVGDVIQVGKKRKVVLENA